MRQFEKRWQLGGVLFSKTFPDQMINLAANDEARKFYEEKVRAVIDDPEVADLLIPTDHPIGTKRICTDTNYFQTFNRAERELVSVRNTPIESVDATGDQHHRMRITTSTRSCWPPGFDAMTGTLAKIDIVGRGGQRLVDDWARWAADLPGSRRRRVSQPVPGVRVPARRRYWPTWCCTPRRT